MSTHAVLVCVEARLQGLCQSVLGEGSRQVHQVLQHGGGRLPTAAAPHAAAAAGAGREQGALGGHHGAAGASTAAGPGGARPCVTTHTQSTGVKHSQPHSVLQSQHAPPTALIHFTCGFLMKSGKKYPTMSRSCVLRATDPRLDYTQPHLAPRAGPNPIDAICFTPLKILEAKPIASLLFPQSNMQTVTFFFQARGLKIP